MKIIRLSTFLDFGGVETRLANISYCKDDNDWVFVCMNRKGKAASVIEGNGKRVINLDSKPSIYSFITFVKIYKLLRLEKPDVLHTSGAEANFHGIIAAKLAGVKTIIGEEIGTPVHNTKAKFIFSKVYKLADYVLGNSDSVLQVVHKVDSVPLIKLKKIANPIIFKELPKVDRDENQDFIFKIFMISRLEPVKNIEGVIDVVLKLVNNDFTVHLYIAGTGSSETVLRDKVTKFNLENYVSFLGFITDPYPHFLSSHLYILNSFSEGFSNSLVEAMYSKTLSLSTEVGAAPEIIKDNYNGFIIPADDCASLYEKIINIMRLSQLQRDLISLQGHHTVVQRYSLEQHINALMEVYKNTRDEN